MGYYTSFEGEISITPPLNWTEIRDSEWLPAHANNKSHAVMLGLAEETIETDEGTLTRRCAVAVVPFGGAYKGYNIIEDVAALIAAYPGHAFAGQFNCKGEDTGDLWRLVVADNKVEKVEPRIVWPDGTEGGF